MIIDSHYHLDERIISTENLIKKMDQAGIDRAALIACMNDPLPDVPPALEPVLRFLLRHRLLRPMGRALVADFLPNGNLKTPKGEVNIYRDPDNEAVFKTADRFPQRFHCWVFLNPRGTRNQLEELNPYTTHPAFIGVKAHPFWHQYAPKELAPAAAELVKTGKPLLMHAGFGAHGDYQALLDEVPGLRIILAHAAFPLYKDSWKKIRGNPNICVDLSQTVYVDSVTARHAVQYLGEEQCIFGTDGPYGPADGDGLFDMGYIRRMIENQFPEQRVRDNLLGGNLAALCGIK